MEICFIWEKGCTASEQYAAWMQAIFSVIAIVAAILISRSQTKYFAQERKNSDIEVLLRIRHLVIECITLFDNMHSSLTNLDDFLAKPDSEDFRILGRYIENIKLDNIPHEMIGRVVIKLRKSVDHAEGMARFYNDCVFHDQQTLAETTADDVRYINEYRALADGIATDLLVHIRVLKQWPVMRFLHF